MRQAICVTDRNGTPIKYAVVIVFWLRFRLASFDKRKYDQTTKNGTGPVASAPKRFAKTTHMINLLEK